MAHFRSGLMGAGIVALALATASAASATDLGTVGGPAWTLNGDGSYSEAITGFANGGGFLNDYTFALSGAANFYDVSVVGNTGKGGDSVAGYLFSLSGPGVSDFGIQPGKVADFSDVISLVPGIYEIDIVAFATKETGTATFGGTVDVAPVPLPAALPLFGSVLAGLGFYGVRRRNKSKAA